MKRTIVLPIVLCIVILLAASTVLAAYGPQRFTSSGGSSSSSSAAASSGGSSGSSGDGSCAIGYKLLDRKCVKTEVTTGEKPSEQPVEAVGEQPAAPLEQPAAQEALAGVSALSNLAWLWTALMVVALAVAVALYVYRRRGD